MESSKIYSICQLNDGFIWLGTDIGVTRFDGLQFENYTIKDNLAKGGARVLFKDIDDVLWIGHEGGGLSRYRNHTFEIISIADITTNITSFCQDKNNVLWITTLGNGVYKINNPKADMDKLDISALESKSVSNVIFNSYVSSDSTLFFITDVGIQRKKHNEDVFVRHIPKDLDTYFQFSVIFQDGNENIWYGTFNGGLYKQNAITGIIEYFDIKNGLASNWITDIIESKTGEIWISHWDMGLRGGVTRISKDGTFKVFNTDNGLHDNKIWCIQDDIEGNILIGTTEHGLDIFKGERLISFSEKNGLTEDQITSICQAPDGNFWVGTNQGLNYGNLFENQLKIYNQEKNQISNKIRFLKYDKNNNLWIGTEDQGVEEYNFREQRFVSKPDINQRLPRISKAVWAMEIDTENRLWIGTVTGLLSYDINRHEYLKTYSKIDSLPSNEVKSLFCDQSGKLWIGTQNGGLSFFQNGAFKSIPYEEKITPNSICENSKHQIIIGTEAHGVFIIENDSIIQQFTLNDGLFTNNSRFVITDDFDNIYVGTTVGLNKIIADKNIILSYSERNGFVGIEAKPNACYKDDNGKLWFGTLSGLTCYNPHVDQSAPSIPQTHITTMFVNGEKMDSYNNLEFPSYKNNIVINYSSISVYDPSSVTYKIMLKGADDIWENAGQQRSANYRALPPGSYHFNVVAVNAHGNSSELPTTISFTILAPLYKRPWFIALLIGIGIVITIIIVRLRERNLRIEKKVLAEKVAERTRELNQTYLKLSERSKDIMDSIRYAQRIQSAITQNEIPYEDTFCFFKPKDVVSGDFYWSLKHNQKEYLAAVDCTGHGVPGAFMSLIGYSSLNKVVVEMDISEPSEILHHLNKEIIRSLNQRSEHEVNDGMDLSLVCFNPNTKELEYAGAYNPLWLVRNNELIEIKADRFAIGRSTGEDKIFTNHQVKIEPDDMIYLFSDGYADQFGGPIGKKFKSTSLKNLLVSISNLPIALQEQKLLSTFEEWKGSLEQIDDILIIGRRFTLK